MMSIFIANLDVENIVYGIIVLAGLVATVYCTFFTSQTEDEDKSRVHDDINPMDDDDSSDD